jgi:hypothetical protein
MQVQEAPEALIGRLTVMVANHAPRKMKFGVCEGMVLAASGDGPGIFLLAPDTGAQTVPDPVHQGRSCARWRSSGSGSAVGNASNAKRPMSFAARGLPPNSSAWPLAHHARAPVAPS